MPDAVDPTPTRAALVVNQRAGTLLTMPGARDILAQELTGAGFELVGTVDAEASLDEQWAAAEASEAPIVFVAGGDGTLRDAAARLLPLGRALAPLPGGTLNKLCHRLALGDDPVAAARSYRAAKLQRIDVGMVNEELFLFQSVVGQPTRLMRLREKHRGEGTVGWLPLLRGAGRALLRPTRNTLWVRLGPGRRVRGHAAVITVPAPGEPDAGLQLELARPEGAFARLRQAWAWFRGRLGAEHDVFDRERPWILLHGGGARIRLSVDGELRLLAPPLRFRLRRDALSVLAPDPGVS